MNTVKNIIAKVIEHFAEWFYGPRCLTREESAARDKDPELQKFYENLLKKP